MATIKISTDLATNLGGTNGIIRVSVVSTSPGFGSNQGTASEIVSRIRIMSGPVPSQQEIEDAYPLWDRFTGSPTEILIDSQNVVNNYFDSVNGTITWDLKAAVADVSGLASWWIWSGNTNYVPGDNVVRGDAPGAPDSKRLPCIIGDITGLTGGGSMTLVELNIIAGQTYEIGPASLVMPRSFTYV